MTDPDRLAVTAHGPRLWRPTSAQLLALDVCVVIAGYLAGQYIPPVEHVKYGGTAAQVAVYVLWFLVSVGFLFRRRFPRATLAVLLVLLFASLLLRSSIPVANYLAFVVYSVAVTSHRRAASIAALVTFVVPVIGIGIGGGTMEGGAILSVAANVLIGWLAGEYVRTNRRHAAVRAQFIAERAVIDERAKLARELHDVVAHGMSVVAVRAGIARMLIETHPEQAREALAIIETTTRSTLQEMRLLVGVLRSGDTEADRGPAPGLDDLAGLVDSAELSGLHIDVDTTGRVRPLAAALDLSAYRIVQEALTNAARHAGPTAVHVALDYGPELLTIDVRDDGPGARSPSTPTLAEELQRTGGHGLIGIRERAALFGGTCVTGPQGKGFRVRVTLNITELQDDTAANPTGAIDTTVAPVPRRRIESTS